MEEKATKGQRPPASDAQSPANKKRFRVWADIVLAPKIWYRLKTRVDMKADGSAVIRAKAWKRDEPEPEEWSIEAVHKVGHKTGIPGLYGLSGHPKFRVYLDNIKITPNR